jgi:ribosomal protein S24E
MKEELAWKFSIFDTQTIFISTFHMIGPLSKGFGIIYDSVKDTIQHEPKHRLAQNDLKTHVQRSTKISINRTKKNYNIKSTQQTH